MSIELTVNISPETAVEPLGEPPMPPTDLIFDDGEPLESNRHRIAMNVLIRSFRTFNPTPPLQPKPIHINLRHINAPIRTTTSNSQLQQILQNFFRI